MRSRSAAKLAAMLVLVVLSPDLAAALDGEVLINQAKANSGGVTPGDTPGFPVTISRTGKYKLIGNLTVAADRNAIQVAADNVTLDLNGFRISGGSVGVAAGGRDGLTVMNGTITNAASDGVRARSFAVVQDMQITNNGGMGVRLDNSGRVLRSTMSGNASVNVSCVSRCLIASNVVTGSVTESGVGFFNNNGTRSDAGGHLVLDNVIANNKLFAIYAEGATAYANNTITGNGTFNGSSVIGSASQAHPNYCVPACP